MNTINTLHDALLNRGKIFHKNEIMRVFDEYKKIKVNAKCVNKNVLEYMSKHSYVKRIFLSYYYINSYDEKKRDFRDYSDREIIFYVLNREKIGWYIGLNSAIYEEGKTWQGLKVITIINTRTSGKRKIMGLNVKFIKTKESLIFGLKKSKTKHSIEYFYSDPAKTYIDRVYFRETDNLERVKNTLEYLKRYPKWVGKK